MPSPFPGMNPYLEEPSIWPTLHCRLIFAIKKLLRSSLSRPYALGMGTHRWLLEKENDPQADVVPDFVGECDEAGPRTEIRPSDWSTLPYEVQKGARYLEVTVRGSALFVTVIEVLTPGNKKLGPDRNSYLVKRAGYLAERINLVEIDLLRGGNRMPMCEPGHPEGDYFVVVSQQTDFPRIGIWPISLRDPLPTIPIPLLPGDPCIDLPLQECLRLALLENGVDDEIVIDYSKPPVPPLSEPDATWAREILAHRPV